MTNIKLSQLIPHLMATPIIPPHPLSHSLEILLGKDREMPAQHTSGRNINNSSHINNINNKHNNKHNHNNNNLSPSVLSGGVTWLYHACTTSVTWSYTGRTGSYTSYHMSYRRTTWWQNILPPIARRRPRLSQEVAQEVTIP